MGLSLDRTETTAQQGTLYLATLLLSRPTRAKVTLSKSAVGSALMLTLGVITAPSASAGPVFTAGTETLTTSSYNANFMQGADFTADVALSLTALGLWDGQSDGLPRAFQVGLWETASETLLASVIIDSVDPLDGSVVVAGGSWRYETLPTPILLSAGTSYTLGFQVGSPDLTVADTLLLTYATLGTDPNVTVPDASRFEMGAAFQFPSTFFSPSGLQFRAMVNAQVQAVPAPEPTTLVLVGSGLAMAAIRRRTRRTKTN